MKIAFISRSSLLSDPGGDTIQMQKTAAKLRHLGAEVDIIPNGSNFNPKEYDLFHFFNLIRPGELLPYLSLGKPYVISPIYVDYSWSDKYARTGLVSKIAFLLNKHQNEYLKAVIRFIKGADTNIAKSYFRKGHFKSMQKVLSGAKCLLPNSESEYNRISGDFKAEIPYSVIPNASSDLFFIDTLAQRKNKKRILCIARLEPRKNQKNLILAMNELPDYELLIIGAAGANSSSYYDECRALAAKNISFLEGNFEQADLKKYYLEAQVHILPSWFETTGLSSLEAAACGCNIVISKYGDSQDYFKEFTEYCDPENIQSIKMAIEAAANKSQDMKLATHVKENYNWQLAADKTFEVYRSVLE